MSTILKTCHKVFACYKTTIVVACQRYQKDMMFSVTEATGQYVLQSY